MADAAPQVERPRSRLRTWLPRIVAWALFAAFIAVVLSSWADHRAFFALIPRAQPAWLFAALALQAGTYAAEAAVWLIALGRMGARAPLRSMLELAFVKLFTDSVVPSGGIAGSILVVRGFEKRKIDPVLGTAAVLVGVMTSYAGNAIAIAVALAILHSGGRLDALVLVPIAGFTVLAVVVPGLILALSGDRQAQPRLRFMNRIPLLRNIGAAAARVPGHHLRDPSVLIAATTLEILIVALDAATLDALLRALGEDVPYPSVFAALVIAMITGLVTVIPSGLGTFDAACVALLVAGGAKVEPALLSILLYRGVTQFLPLLPGALLARRELSGTASAA